MHNDNCTLHLTFTNTAVDNKVAGDYCCNVLTHVFVVGDLKFYAQMLGRENMSLSWCIWCLLSLSEWKLSESDRYTHGIPAELDRNGALKD